nr:hypothetical protein [Paenibacillus xylanexedens]
MSRLYLLFIYKDGVAYNSMGIKGTADELFEETKRITKEIHNVTPRAEVGTKLVYWD